MIMLVLLVCSRRCVVLHVVVHQMKPADRRRESRHRCINDAARNPVAAAAAHSRVQAAETRLLGRVPILGCSIQGLSLCRAKV